MHSRAQPRSLSHPSLTYASPSLPRVAYFDIVLLRTRAQNRAPSRCRRAPPDGCNSRTYDWRDAPALGPRDCKHAPFLGEFSEPSKEATEWESAHSGYLRSCNSRFSSVSSGDSASSPGSPGEKTVPFCATWKGIFAHHRQPSLPPDPTAEVCPSVQRGWLPPPASPFPVEKGPVYATWTGPSSRLPPRDVSVSACATWVGTSSRPSLPFSSSGHLTHPEGSSFDGKSTPLATRAAPYARASRPATCAAPYVP
jgi:hypothetical protein